MGPTWWRALGMDSGIGNVVLCFFVTTSLGLGRPQAAPSKSRCRNVMCRCGRLHQSRYDPTDVTTGHHSRHYCCNSSLRYGCHLYRKPSTQTCPRARCRHAVFLGIRRRLRRWGNCADSCNKPGCRQRHIRAFSNRCIAGIICNHGSLVASVFAPQRPLCV